MFPSVSTIKEPPTPPNPTLDFSVNTDDDGNSNFDENTALVLIKKEELAQVIQRKNLQSQIKLMQI